MAATYNPLEVKIGSDDVAEYFPKILHRFYFPNDEKDNVLIAVARMLLTGERTKEKSQYQSVVNWSPMLTDGKLEHDTILDDDSVFRKMEQGIWFTFLYDETAEKEIEALKSYEGEYKELGWEPMPDVARYIDNTGKTLVYQNKKRKAVIIITKSAYAIKSVHMAASAFTRLLPWYFDKVPLTETETNTLKALFGGDNKTFDSIAQQFYIAQGFELKKLQKMISGFCKVDYKDQIEDIENRISSLRRQITDYYNAIRDSQDQIERKQMDIIVFRNKATDGKDAETDFINFVKSNNAVHILDRDNDKLRIGITCNLDDYDETVFHTYVENPKTNNYIYEASPYDADITKRFLMSIWKEHRWNLRVYCEWTLYDNCGFGAVENSRMGGRPELKANRIPQYHIDRYQCYGGWEGAMNECKLNRDYEGLVNLFVASSHTINWGDSTVVSKFMDRIWNNQNDKIFEDRTGALWSAKEILEQLEKEPKQAEPAAPIHKKRERPTVPVTPADDELAFPA